MYAYSVRGSGNPELHSLFEKRVCDLIASNPENLDFPSMFNLLYYMMFRQNPNETIWRAILDSTIEQQETLPLVYYKPFKFSKYFLQHHHPSWDLSDYTDKFWYAEQYFNQIQFDNLMTSDDAYFRMKCFLNQKCLVYPICFMTVDNLFNMHYVFHE